MQKLHKFCVLARVNYVQLCKNSLRTANSVLTDKTIVAGIFKNCPLTFGTGVLHLIQINHQPGATICQFIILTFVYNSTCFGLFPAHHQALNDCSGSLWFYLRIVVTVVLCSWSGRPAGRPDHEHGMTVTMIRR